MDDSTTLRIFVSGVSYFGACDPLASGVPVEENWPEPTRIRAGKGFRFIYEGDRVLAEQIASHLESLAEGFAYSDDPSTKAEGRAFARDAVRIRQTMTD